MFWKRSCSRQSRQKISNVGTITTLSIAPYVRRIFSQGFMMSSSSSLLVYMNCIFCSAFFSVGTILLHLLIFPIIFSSFHRWLAILINIVFLFFVLVVLLNILIAQLSDTYADVKSDALRELEHNWGIALTSMEQGSLLVSTVSLISTILW